MDLTDSDRRQLISALDSIEEATRRIVLGTLNAFSDWLADILPTVFRRIGEGISKIWTYLKGLFR